MAPHHSALLLLCLLLVVPASVFADTDDCGSATVSNHDIDEYRNSIDSSDSDKKEMKYFDLDAIGSSVKFEIQGGKRYQIFVGRDCLPTRSSNDGSSACGGSVTLGKSNLDTKVKIGVAKCDLIDPGTDTVKSTVSADTGASCTDDLDEVDVDTISTNSYCGSSACVLRASLLLLALALMLTFHMQ